ncbi:tRNA (N6-isopentenyl adenosine(37)-C2)-methylthiotransferase MiaB [Candidatus Peregrinibacteria bacterium]|nr:tRNA (N6-isopentenyl adenosine(37)-C2)-methylthiotransferase MiaB [Candidatus Peregrinibacteria bacterium]
MKYLIKTYGCQFNYSDSERTSAVLETAGFEPTQQEENADFIIFNTCSIRQKAEDRVYGLMPLISELKLKNKSLKVAITGCMVRKSSTRKTTEPDPLIKNLDTLDMTFRIEDVANLPNLLKEIDPEISLNKAPDEFDAGTLKNYFSINPKYASKFQAFVPIARGCDKFCAFCIVPFTRGREKSRDMDEILAECERLVQNGCKEITLLGQNVDSYGLSYLDREEKRFAPLRAGEKIYFTRLLEELNLLKLQGLKRVRWISPHPKDMTDDLIEAAARLETQMPYIHLPVQAGSNAVLKRMNRPYTVSRYLERIKKIRSAIPDCAISTDIIVGFCGETKEQFEETCALFEEVRWDMAYLAQYSMRKFTAAYRTMKDDITRSEKERRWHRLNDILTRVSLEKHRTFVGKTVEVLVERCENGMCEGRSEHFKRTQFKGTPELIGRIVSVKVTEAFEWYMKGKQSEKQWNEAH